MSEPAKILAKPAVPAVEAPKPVPRIPVREPVELAAWRVSVRHCPVIAAKSLVVQARGKEDAWAKFLAASQAAQTEKAYKGSPGGYERAMQWYAAAKAVMPAGVEILSEAYSEARKAALRIKGTVSRACECVRVHPMPAAPADRVTTSVELGPRSLALLRRLVVALEEIIGSDVPDPGKLTEDDYENITAADAADAEIA